MDVTTSIADVAMASEETGASANELSVSSESLKQLSAVLAQEVDSFLSDLAEDVGTGADVA